MHPLICAVGKTASSFLNTSQSMCCRWCHLSWCETVFSGVHCYPQSSLLRWHCLSQRETVFSGVHRYHLVLHSFPPAFAWEFSHCFLSTLFSWLCLVPLTPTSQPFHQGITRSSGSMPLSSCVHLPNLFSKVPCLIDKMIFLFLVSFCFVLCLIFHDFNSLASVLIKFFQQL